jgi:hypothetical protein
LRAGNGPGVDTILGAGSREIIEHFRCVLFQSP